MSTMNGKRANFTLLLALLGILILALAALTVLSVIKITETSAAISDEEQALRDNESKLAKMELLSSIEDELRQIFARISWMIPEQANADQLIAYLNRLSENSGMGFLTVEFSEKVVNNNNKPNEMPLSLTFRGSFPHLIALLKDMGRGERLIRIDEIRIDNTNVDPENMKISMKARAFYR